MSRPNLLIIHTDQQSAWTLSCYGGDSTRVDTPNIDRLAVEGALFSEFFTNSAVCTPSRGCFLTGRYPHCHGAYANNIPLHEDEITLAHCLARSGWDTGYVGKWHLDGDSRNTPPGWILPEHAFGFQDHRWMFNDFHPKSILEDRSEKPRMTHAIGEGPYGTDWLTDKAIEFLGRDRSAPFLLMLSLPDPHTPYSVREPYASMFNPEDVTVPETFWDEQVPDWVMQGRERYAYAFHNSISDPNREQNLRRQKAAYCGAVKCIDYNVGRILSFLADRDMLDDTIVVFTTDHGDYMGEHGLYGKGTIYEASYHIPLVIRWPAVIPGGLVIDNMVSTVDFQQTILGLMGLPPSGREQGWDASSVLRGQHVEGPTDVFAHNQCFIRASVFTPHWNFGIVPQAQCMLFDRRNDPLEQHNLYGDPAYNEIVVELARRVMEHHQAVDSPCAMWTKLFYDAQRDLIRHGQSLNACSE